MGNSKRKNRGSQMNLADENYLQDVLKQASRQTKKQGGIGSKIVGSIAKNPKSIIPFIVLLIYFASCGLCINVKWIYNLILWLINLF